MRTFLTLALWAFLVSSQAQLNMAFVGRLDYQPTRGSDISDVWGYVDETGIEYALVGVNGGGVSIVSLADPTNPVEVFWFPGDNTIWRDLKVWNDHVYVTNEGGNGLAIIDLGPLPQSTALTAQNWSSGGWTSAHNLYIDENGIAYISGANRGNGGIIFLDLNQDPFQPVEVGEFDQWYSHDCMVRGDTMYSAHISDGFFSIVDVSNKQAPVILGTQNTGNNFTHNCWVSDDGRYLYTTDEVTGGWLGSYDISDPTDIQELQLFRSDPGSNTIPHNTHFINEFVVTSYYRLGTTVHDVSRPNNVVEVANYDHSPFEGNGFNGAWGTYPWLPSGRIISTDIERGLYVLDVEYVRACWLEGTVRNSVTAVPVPQATVDIVSVVTANATGFDGRYATGHSTAGTYTVTVSAPGYEDATITGVVLQNGVLTELDIDLVPLVPFDLIGTVLDGLTGAPLPGASVLVSNSDFTLTAESGADGTFIFPGFFAGDYDVLVGKWGWVTNCEDDRPLSASGPELVVTLQRGYYDDFEFDFDWTVASTATLGAWERGVPVGTTFDGQQSNPGGDAAGDCGEQAFVTGNGGGGAGADDVDDGNTILTSPVFDLTDVWAPELRYHRWFFNEGGAGSPNDRMRISLDNGTTSVVLEEITASGSASGWIARDYRIEDFIEPSSTMRLIVFITDDNPGHLVEGGFDRFEVVSTSSVGIDEPSSTTFSLWPNPSEGRMRVSLGDDQEGSLVIMDATGRMVLGPVRVQGGSLELDLRVPAGTYMAECTLVSGERIVRRLVIAR
ncbi:MAG: choice-of-anchor B family protein [Flavobacteriales bacterium]